MWWARAKENSPHPWVNDYIGQCPDHLFSESPKTESLPDWFMVEVTGRGGTVLQPGVDLLEKAKDFPVKGPLLIITDGYIEDNLRVKREHAFLIPKGNRLPFRPKGKVFYFRE